jgi:hypothetical protein
MSADGADGAGDGHGGDSGGDKLKYVIVGVIVFIVITSVGSISSCGQQMGDGARSLGAGVGSGINSVILSFRSNGGFFMGLAAFIGFLMWVRKK